jgi:hypothetical protein
MYIKIVQNNKRIVQMNARARGENKLFLQAGK